MFTTMADDALLRDPFEFRIAADGRVMIYRGGRLVSTVAGDDANRLRGRLAQAGGAGGEQQLLARATGDYRRGSERHS